MLLGGIQQALARQGKDKAWNGKAGLDRTGLVTGRTGTGGEGRQDKAGGPQKGITDPTQGMDGWSKTGMRRGFLENKKIIGR